MIKHVLPLRERKKAERRQNILVCSRRLFDNDGFDNTTIETIASVVDVAVGTIYKFFPTKIDILTQLLSDDLSSFREASPRISPTTTESPVLGIHQLLQQQLEALAMLPKQYLALVTAHAIATARTTETGRIYAASHAYLLGEIRTLLEAYQDHGKLPQSTNIDFLSRLIFDMASGGQYEWLIGEYDSIGQLVARLRIYLELLFEIPSMAVEAGRPQ